jgi:hypothetical protein
MVNKIRVYNIVSDDYYNDKNSIFSGRYFKVRRINYITYGIQLYKIW